MNDELRARIIAAAGSASAGEAGVMLGVSRNVVAGVWYRAGIHRDRVRKSVKMSSASRADAHNERLLLAEFRAGHTIVTGHGCKFIEGDPAGAATIYCDAPRISAEHSYCAKHDRLCHSHAPLSKLTVRYK